MKQGMPRCLPTFAQNLRIALGGGGWLTIASERINSQLSLLHGKAIASIGD